MLRYIRRGGGALIASFTALFMVATIASAAPPTSGRAPVSQVPLAVTAHIGSRDNDVAAMSTCTIGGRPLIFIGGDFTSWTDSAGTHRATRLIAVDQRNFRLVWTASSVAGGYIRTVDCFVYNSGRSARVYVGGSFTGLNGRTRVHDGAFAFATDSSGHLHSGLAGWHVTAGSSVSSIVHDASRVYITTGSSAMAVSHIVASHIWTTTAECITTMLVHGSSLFIGGFFRSVRGSRGAALKQYGLARLTASNGLPYARFRPTFKQNQKSCSDPTATGSQTYSGSVPLSLTYDPYTHGLVVGDGGIDNQLGEMNLTTGAWHWRRPMDGDGQSVRMFYRFVFYGHHRFGPNVGNYHYEADEIGGFFNGATGVQAPWNPPFSGNGADRDGAHNGVTSSVVIRPHGKYLLCVGGGFVKPVHGLACFQER